MIKALTRCGKRALSTRLLDLTLHRSYDSDPADETAEKSDYGVTTSLGYSFY